MRRSRDSDYLYRFDSYFYYLSGFPEPEAVLVLLAGEEPRSILFCRERNPERELWEGVRNGPEGARAAFGFDEAYPVESLDEKRLFKDDGELAVMRRAAAISAAAHERAMRATRRGRSEYEIEAELLYEFRRRGAQYPAYWPIVAGGANACILHYRDNNARLSDGDLLLIDAGCELDGYASDVTRTFPVSGKFSGPQKDVYELVLAAQAAAIAAVKPGNRWDEPHNAAVKTLARGFVDLGLCHGTVEKVIEAEDYKRFYMHRTGHWLGLDVHDAGEYKSDGQWRRLEPGMILTVEPGCYIRPADDVPQQFWNTGVRIEDDGVGM